MIGSLRFLVDVGVGRGAERALADDGHDVVSVRDRDPSLADDAILALAAAEGRIVLTMDRDFGALVFQSSRPQAGVLLLRMLNATSRETRAFMPSRAALVWIGRGRWDTLTLPGGWCHEDDGIDG